MTAWLFTPMRVKILLKSQASTYPGDATFGLILEDDSRCRMVVVTVAD
jgi:hypothetical protein